MARLDLNAHFWRNTQSDIIIVVLSNLSDLILILNLWSWDLVMILGNN